MSLPIISISIQFEHDVVESRQRARQVAEALGFEGPQQTRLATAVSEITRNAFTYAGGGRAEFFLDGSSVPQLLLIRVTDHGKGISNLAEILEGRYRSDTGMGLGITGARRLMDKFTITTAPGEGTEVVLGKLLPRRAPLITPAMLSKLVTRIEKQKPRTLLHEFREQNRELMRTLDELRKRQDELLSLNRELEDTNRGVVALYAELDERADRLRSADDLKSRFLWNMSHEFRTPLNSILALSHLLIDRADGDLTAEQETQVAFIRKSAESLYQLVNDLLDFAKVEAGKTVVRPIEFKVNDLFGALRGMLRPLLAGSTVSLNFEEADQIPDVYSDEGKISQILRNFISNALKFTQTGEVRVSASHDANRSLVEFHVKDTGIGIAPEHIEKIFEEFGQIDNPIQRTLKGTGLGLTLSRKLAAVLGGSVSVASQVGTGSVFSVSLPQFYAAAKRTSATETLTPEASRQRSVLVVEDHFETRLLYTKMLQDSPWQILSAKSIREAENILRNVTPSAILLDTFLTGEDTFQFLAQLKSDDSTHKIAVLVVTAVDDRSKAMALGADAYAVKPITRQFLLDTLRRLADPPLKATVLLVDDEDVSRYLWKQLLNNPDIRLLEATDGANGLERARMEKPDLVIMDLSMPRMNGFEAIDSMKKDPVLRDIPVLVSTSKILTEEDFRCLAGHVLGIMPKASLSESGIESRLRSMLQPASLEYLVASPETATKGGNR